MGLENGFVLKHKNAPADVGVHFYYICSFHELDNWMKQNCKEIAEEEYEVTGVILEKLKSTIEREAQYLHSLSPNLVWYYDDEGYPDLVNKAFYGETFSLNYQLIKLYDTIGTMLDILEMNEEEGYYFIFYSSN